MSCTDFSDLENLEDLDPCGDPPIKTVSSQATVARYEEKCQKCRGSGIWTSWNGLSAGKCYACKGEGVRRFKTSPQTRHAQRDAAAARRAAMPEKNWAKFEEAHPEQATWISANFEGIDFAHSLREAVLKYGRLTPGQISAVNRCIARATDKAEARKTELPAGPDLRAIPDGLYAVPDGDTRLKVRISVPDAGKWAGWVFVTDGAEYGDRQRYGSQRPGEDCYRGKIADQLAAIAADPNTASRAYGRLVGKCGVCGRKLEDKASVAAGIGPVCARKRGWKS